jgi:transcriptional regulator with XRE-family HTH domain
LRRQGRLEAVANFIPGALFEARRACGITLDDLGELVGIRRPNLIAYEKGRRTPSPERLVQLAGALKVDPLQLTTATPATATVADLRVRVGLSAPEAADLLGVARSEFRAFEAGGRDLPSEVVGPLCELLNVSEAELMAACLRPGVERVEELRGPETTSQTATPPTPPSLVQG